MTIFAGAYSLAPHSALPDGLCDAIRRTLSRFDGEVLKEARAGSMFMAKADIGGFGAEAFLAGPDGSTTMLAGEALLPAGDDDPAWNRSHDVAVLHAQLQADDVGGLAGARGTFCGAHYNTAQDRLSLFVDKVGVRPLYYWVGPQFIVFATALRILEAIDEVRKEFDVRGVAEITAYEYPLADRTPYLGIRMLRAGELVRIDAAGATAAPYWRWDGPLAPAESDSAAVERCYAAFIGAIRRRQRGTAVAATFLSGGLDSRAIVGGLDAIGCQIYTVNYAPDGTQDQVFAKLIAEKLELHYSQLHTNAENVAQGYRKTAVAAWIRDTFSMVNVSARPPLFWSGDGGSVALGHVYLSPAIVEAMERGDAAAAIDLLKREVPSRLIPARLRAEIAGLPAKGAAEELARIDCADPGRAFHLFLMLNDQRRHLAQHFEDIDLERIEFQLPFFDAAFLETILRKPCRLFLRHKFYLDWLAKFPNGLDSVPWQAYPGHLPCPLPSPAELKLQWEGYYDQKMFRQMSLALLKQGRQALLAASFPHHLIQRAPLALALLLTRVGWRDYGYLVKTACTFARYWAICSASAARLGGKAGRAGRGRAD